MLFERQTCGEKYQIDYRVGKKYFVFAVEEQNDSYRGKIMQYDTPNPRHSEDEEVLKNTSSNNQHKNYQIRYPAQHQQPFIDVSTDPEV